MPSNLVVQKVTKCHLSHYMKYTSTKQYGSTTGTCSVFPSLKARLFLLSVKKNQGSNITYLLLNTDRTVINKTIVQKSRSTQQI